MTQDRSKDSPSYEDRFPDAATETRWVEYAQDHLLNKKIVAVRYMTHAEMAKIGWYCRCVVFQLDDGTIIFPSRDDEGNDAGALFGQGTDGESLTFPVLN